MGNTACQVWSRGPPPPNPTTSLKHRVQKNELGIGLWPWKCLKNPESFPFPNLSLNTTYLATKQLNFLLNEEWFWLPCSPALTFRCKNKDPRESSDLKVRSMMYVWPPPSSESPQHKKPLSRGMYHCIPSYVVPKQTPQILNKKNVESEAKQMG